MNPVVDRMYREESGRNPALRNWPDKKKYMALMFGGSLLESWLLCFGYLLLRGAFARPDAWETALLCALVLGLVRVYPRSFDKWIQTTYPRRLIAVESLNGMIGSAITILAMRLLLSLG
jgi:hypothetical protein